MPGIANRSKGRRAVVVGGGIGGLAAGAELCRLGFDVAVVERREELGEADTGFFLWSFAVQRLRSLGLGEELERIGRPAQRLVTRTWQGRTLTDVSLVADGERPPSFDVHRAGLQAVLADAVGRDRIRLGVPCVAVTESAAGVQARLADGDELDGDLLIGADGVHSTVRERVAGRLSVRRGGVRIWRGILDAGAGLVPDGVHVRVMGPGAVFGAGRLGRRVRWYAGAWPNREDPATPDERKEQVAERFRGWCSPVGELIGATDPASVLLNDAPHGRSPRRWVSERVALLGDAAHPTLPTLATGGGMAIEDASVLAQCLDEASLPDALDRYQRLRRRAAVRVQRGTLLFGGVLALRAAPAVRARDAAFARSGAVQARAARRLAQGP